MIKFVDGNFLDTDANFIVNQVVRQEVQSMTKIEEEIFEKYPHIESEYIKYIRHCKKNKINIFGNVQYVPVDIWAIVMVDTMNNNNIIEYDENFKYICNVFCNTFMEKSQNIKTDFESFKKALLSIYNVAKTIKNSKILIPCKKNDDKTIEIIKDIFYEDGIDVEIFQY